MAEPLRKVQTWVSLGRMCGRFALTTPQEMVAEWFQAIPAEMDFSRPRFNVCPTQTIQVAVSYENQRRMVPMRWGFIPHWYKTPADGPLLINARSETLFEKPSFRAAAKSRRCLIPASGFYEWHREKGKGKEPWFFQSKEPIVAFGGIWQAWTDPDKNRLVACAIVTTQAGPDMAQIHHREPVTLGQNQFETWLAGNPAEIAPFMGPREDGFFSRYRVSTEINGARIDEPHLIEPLET